MKDIRTSVKLLSAVAAVLLTTLLTSCGDDPTLDRRYTDYRSDIVTYLGNDENGARYELLHRGDSVAVQLLGDRALSEAFHDGQRVLLRYEWADNTTAGHRHITTHAVSAIVSDSLRYNTHPIEQYIAQMEPVRLLSLWRTGGYINLHCLAEYTGKPRHFYLLLDSATRNRETVHCYLINNTLGDTTYHWREAYASFYVGNAWNRDTCRELVVHLNDADKPQKREYTFKKE